MDQSQPNNITKSIFVVLLLSIGLLAGCEKKSDLMIDSSGTAPIVSNGRLSPTLINTDTMRIGGEVNAGDVLSIPFDAFVVATHPGGPSAIAQVSYELIDRADGSALASGNMSTSDSVYSAHVQFQFVRQPLTTLWLHVTAQDKLGYAGSTLLLPLRVGGTNRPPVISNLQCPDTVKPSVVSTFIVTVKVVDPDGLQDIASVTRTTQQGNVYALNDSGVNGDAVAGDGIYTETISVSPAPPAGSYLFKYQATDKTGAKSNILTKTVVIAP